MHTIFVRNTDRAIIKARKELATVVLGEFEDYPSRLLCFFDSEDCQIFKQEIGEANRGFFAPVKFDGFWRIWPEYLKDRVLLPESEWGNLRQDIDEVIFLHGSTCDNEIGMTMSLAHELQHRKQQHTARQALAANQLALTWLRQSNPLDLEWTDIPSEREARIVSKKVAQKLHGISAVAAFVESVIEKPVNDLDAKDWKFIRSIDPNTDFDLPTETLKLFPRLVDHRAAIETIFESSRIEEQFSNIDLDELFGTRSRSAR